MGFELMAAGTAVAASAAAPVYAAERQASAAREQKRANRAQAAAQAESNRISAARQESERQAAIRKQVREERIRRAQVISAAEAAGVTGSSVETTTVGTGQTLAASGRAFAEGQTLAANLQTNVLQQGADLSTFFSNRANTDTGQGQLGSALGQLGQSAFTSGLVKLPTGG